MGDIMRIGEIERSKGGEGESLTAALGFWAEKDGEWVKIHLRGPSITTVTNNPASQRYHRTLFRDLRRALIAQGCWSFGEAGAETEKDNGHLIDFDPIPIRGEPLSATIIADRGPR